MVDEHLALEHATVDAINAELGVQRITVAEFARRLNRKYDSTRNYLTLERRLPLSFVIEAADALGTTPDVLVREAREKHLQKRLQADS